jgi:predicted kinase
MEMVIFTGIQGSGKSTFYARRFFHSHVRINLDMLKTRHRESALIRACLEAKEQLVVDNTNPSREERRKYIELAKEAKFRVVGYYFKSAIDEALRRNGERPSDQKVPDRGIRGTHGRLEIPSMSEGYDQLYYVRITADGEFVVEEWKDEV